jgi:uncharacterized cupin superfamily protein
MIIRNDPSAARSHDGDPEGMTARRISDEGGVTQFGAYVVTLAPGARSSERHWHEKEDEFMFVLAGEVTVLENDGAHVLGPGDAACWPAGSDNAHSVVNRSDAPCSFLVAGTRVTHDVCHYPDVKRVLHTEGDTWRLVDEAGAVLKSGRVG